MGQTAMNDSILTSGQNPKIKQLLQLRERKERDQSGLFIIEGYRELLRANEAGWIVEQLFFCPELYLGENETTLIDAIKKQKAFLYQCSEPLFRKISYRDRPDGLVAVAKQKHPTLKELEPAFNKKQPPLFIVAEAIEKPGNLGTILRSADAVGTTGLIVCDRCTDIYNPNVVRASVGTLFTVPTIDTTSQDALAWLRKNSVKIVAATPHATDEFTQVDLAQPIAIAVGTEQLGLSPLWMEQADIQVKIPMRGIADSLNVAMATTLLLYEALRQRQVRGF